MDILIQTVGSGILFYNKIQLLKEKNVAWLLGIVGVIILSWPIYQNHLWINLVYNCGLITLMIYGYALSMKTDLKVKFFWKTFFRSLVILLTIGMSIYLYTQTTQSKIFGVWQLIQCVTGMAGILCMAFNTHSTKMVGWIVNIVTHVISAYMYVFLVENLYVIGIFQLVSIPIASKAIIKLKKSKRNGKWEPFTIE
jgi:hypothetical protein